MEALKNTKAQRKGPTARRMSLEVSDKTGWILGLDTDTTKTGVVLLPLHGEEPVFSIYLKPKGVFRERSFDTCKLMADFLQTQQDLFDGIMGYIKLCGIEAITGGEFNPGYAIAKGQHYGILASWLYTFGISLLEYCPPQYVRKGRKSPLTVNFIPPIWVKMWATGKRKADKAVILKAVLQKWGQDFETSDEADAYVLARIAREIYLWEQHPEFVSDVDSGMWFKQERLMTAVQEKILEQILAGRRKLKEVQGG